jgi:uncharacterized membrane protein HdeD (DUF308 family)
LGKAVPRWQLRDPGGTTSLQVIFMAANNHNPRSAMLAAEIAGIRKNWFWFLIFGILQVVAGIIAAGFIFSETLATAVTLGVLLLIAGGIQLAAAILAHKWDGFFLFLLLAFLYGLAGLMAVQYSLIGTHGLRIFLAVLFFLVGLYRCAVALVDRVPSWVWLLFNGLVTVGLGLAIWRQWPASGLWALGALVGIELIANGVTWSILALAHRSTEGQS